MLMDYPAPVGNISAAPHLSMPFPDSVKYCILGVSVLLLLLALGILAWQTFRCCTQTRSKYVQRDTLNNDVLNVDEKPETTEGSPSTRVEDLNKEVQRLSRCLSQSVFPSGDVNQTGKALEDLGNIKKVNGTLRFSIDYDQLQSRLVVTILQVDGLQEHGQKDNLNVFIKISLMWSGSHALELETYMNQEDQGMTPVMWTVLQEWRTRIVTESNNPLFGDQFSCVLQDVELHDITLKLEVRDFDKFSRHTVLGEVRVPLGQLSMSYPLELQDDLHLPQKDLVGEVLLSLKFLPTSQRLEVGLLKVRVILPEKSSGKALFARISVQCNQCKSRYQKTSAIPHSLVTVFNEVLMFSLPEFTLERCKILVSVYETHMTKKSSKHLIGQSFVEKNRHSEDRHWSLMMSSIRQPVAKWHGLFL